MFVSNTDLFIAKKLFLFDMVFLTVCTFSKEEYAKKVYDESSYIDLDYITLKADYAKVCI